MLKKSSFLSSEEEFVRKLGTSTPKYADWKYKNLIEQIRQFEEQLDDNHEIALQLASFGTSMVMAVENIGYQNPDLMYFWGTVNGNRAQLIQHISQINFVILAARKADPAKPPRRIGFALPTED